MSPSNICFVASEIRPLAKTGGLADVAAALTAYLHERGHDVRVFMPFHAQIDRQKFDFTPVDFLRDVAIELGPYTFSFSAFVTRLPGSSLPIYCLDCPPLFHRSSLYTGEWDEHLRFAFLARATIACCQRMGFAPDVFHCNDWHTALIPLYLRTLYSWDRLFAGTRTVLTIHNLAYQGAFPAEVLPNLGLANETHLLAREDLERGAVSFLKTGILHADVITTVSITYAREIQTSEFGAGLDGVLRHRSASVIGIVNGIDKEWDPASDRYLAQTYTPETVAEGKRRNRAVLLEKLGLPPAGERVPVLGVVSRLTAQKGFDLFFDVLPEVLRHLDVRFTVLGSGESRYEEFFQRLQGNFPQKVCFYRGYSEELAHLIEAGSDVFLMPSQFEPCGLNQMYSLKYGTPPVVRKTGGLADTVELYNPATGTGTGFVFEHYDATGFAWALRLALSTFQDRAAWTRVQQNGMAQDFSWEKQGAEYEKLYAVLMRHR